MACPLLPPDNQLFWSPLGSPSSAGLCIAFPGSHENGNSPPSHLVYVEFTWMLLPTTENGPQSHLMHFWQPSLHCFLFRAEYCFLTTLFSDNHFNIVFCFAQNIAHPPKTCENGNLVFWYKVNFHSNDIAHQKSLNIISGWCYKLGKLLFSLISTSVGIFIHIYIFVQNSFKWE